MWLPSYSVALTFPPLSVLSSVSLEKPLLTTVTWLPDNFIVLISYLLWITHVCCRKCHRSVPYEITIQLPMFSLSCSCCLALIVSAALFDACTGKHQARHEFAQFLCLKGKMFFFLLLKNPQLTLPKKKKDRKGNKKKQQQQWLYVSNGNVLVLLLDSVSKPLSHIQCFPCFTFFFFFLIFFCKWWMASGGHAGKGYNTKIPWKSCITRWIWAEQSQILMPCSVW